MDDQQKCPVCNGDMPCAEHPQAESTPNTDAPTTGAGEETTNPAPETPAA